MLDPPSLGATVRVHSLVNRPTFNGRRGIVVKAQDANTGRCGLKMLPLEDGESSVETILLKPTNLAAVSDPMAKLSSSNDAEYERLTKLATQLSDAGDFHESAKVCQQALALKPDQPDAHYNLAWRYNRTRQYLLAHESYLIAMKLFQTTLDHDPILQQLEGEAKEVSLVMGRAWWAKSVRGAFYAYKAAEQYRASLGTSMSALPEKPAWMATPEAAVEMAARVVAANPDAVDAWEWQGELQLTLVIGRRPKSEDFSREEKGAFIRLLKDAQASFQKAAQLATLAGMPEKKGELERRSADLERRARVISETIHTMPEPVS